MLIRITVNRRPGPSTSRGLDLRRNKQSLGHATSSLARGSAGRSNQNTPQPTTFRSRVVDSGCRPGWSPKVGTTRARQGQGRHKVMGDLARLHGHPQACVAKRHR
jgi:hypothetical protein